MGTDASDSDSESDYIFNTGVPHIHIFFSFSCYNFIFVKIDKVSFFGFVVLHGFVHKCGFQFPSLHFARDVVQINVNDAVSGTEQNFS